MQTNRGVGYRVRWTGSVVAALVVVISASGCGRPEMLRRDELPVAEPAPALPPRGEAVPCAVAAAPAREMPRAIRIGRSVEGEPLVLRLFGTGLAPTLVIGGIHGDEPTSAYVAERLAAYLEEFPDARGKASVAVLPRANPDGLARRTRQNAQGVDLNRNFPAANWRRRRKRDRYYGGSNPAGEPETRAILRAIEMLRPARIVSIHSIRRDRQCVNYDGPAEDFARLMAEKNGYPVVASLGPCHGSLGNWAGVDRRMPIITLELPRHLTGRQGWEDNREALLLAIRAGRPYNTVEPDRERQ